MPKERYLEGEQSVGLRATLARSVAGVKISASFCAAFSFMSLSARRKKWLKIALEVALLAVIVFGVRAYQQRDVASGVAPAIEAVTLTGMPFSLNDWQGQPVLVYFWASWCPICAAQQGTIADLASERRVITVAMQSGDADAVGKYLRKQDWQVPVIVDADGTLARRYGVNGVPTSYVLDGQGNIRFVEIGYTTAWGYRLRLWLAGL